MKLNRTTAIFAAALALVLVTAGPVSAVLVSELGVLNLSANGGLNPTTGLPWQAGDKFRLVFVTSTTRNATSTNINDYNSFVQSVANASSLGLGSATWNVIASTQTVTARDNTGTNPTVNGTGEAIFLMDGATVLATNYTDLWNGSPVVTASPLLHLAPNRNENGVLVSSRSVFVGSNPNGTNDAVPGTRWLGFAGNVETGITAPNNANRWIEQFNAAATSNLSFYALSNPLTIREATAATVPEPATASLALLGLGGLMMRRRRAV